MEGSLRWELEKRRVLSRSLAVGTLKKSHHYNFTAPLNGFELEEENLIQQGKKLSDNEKINKQTDARTIINT
jgi:hypothetical protein